MNERVKYFRAQNNVFQALSGLIKQERELYKYQGLELNVQNI